MFYKKYRYFYPTALEESYDPFYKSAQWKICFAWLPHYCEISKQRIWFEKGYRGQRRMVGFPDDDPIIEERWHSLRHHLIWQIKKDSNENF